MQKRVNAALYVRVSTGGQSVKNQLRDLKSVAKRENWEIVDVFEDVTSGAKGREHRSGYDALLRGIAQRKYNIVACWSICRISRTLADLISFLADIGTTGTHFFCFQQGIDTQTIGGRMLFQLLGAIAEWERGMIRERVMAGLQRAKAEGKRFGRPPVSKEIEERIRAARRDGKGIRATAKLIGCGVSVVQRLERKMRKKRMAFQVSGRAVKEHAPR